jgi:leader peptidase (prepilin peptidase) / N-methyltransferase
MPFTVILIALLGFIAGGIVNALADDLPHHQRPKLPHYPDGAPRPVSAWSGVLAFLTGQRTSPNGAKLSWRHPITEVVTVIAMVVVYLVTLEKPEMSDLQRAFFLLYAVIFVLVFVIDVEHKLILFAVIIPSCILGILDAILTPVHNEPNLQNAIYGGLLGFGVFFVLYLGGFAFTYVVSRLRGYEVNEVAFGYGDVMLITFSGLILGWQALIFAMFITVFLGAFGAIIYLVVRAVVGGQYAMFTALPYGPYIVIGTAFMLYFGNRVGGWVY